MTDIKIFRRFLFLITTVCLLGLASSISGQDYTSYDGHKFSVSVRPEKATIMFGETTYLVFEVTNHSDTDLFFGDGGDYRNNIGRPESYKVTVTAKDGTPVPQPKVTFGMGGLFGSQQVPAKGSYTRSLFVPHWATFEKPGDYIITVERTLSIGALSEDRADPKPAPVSRATRTKAATTLKVTETDSAKLGTVIRELGEKMLGDNDAQQVRSALSKLDFIKDDRTVEYWIKAVDKYSQAGANDWDITRRFDQTPFCLARYDTPETVAVLERAMRSANDNVRLDVADALSLSSNPRAKILLHSMKDDSYFFVRLRVAQALDKIDTDDSTKILVDLLLDVDRSVRDSAERSLRVRNRLPDPIPRLPIDKQTCSVRQTGAVRTLQTQENGNVAKSGQGGFYTTHNCAVALDKFLSELSARKENKEVLGEAWVLYQIGDIYVEVNNEEKAHHYYSLALPLFRELKSDVERELLSILVGLSITLKRPADALDFLNRELVLTRTNGNKFVRSDEGRVLERIATVYAVMGNEAFRLEYLKKWLDFETSENSSYGMSRALTALGKYHEANGQKNEALKTYQKALEHLKSVEVFGMDWLKNDVLVLTEAIARMQK